MRGFTVWIIAILIGFSLGRAYAEDFLEAIYLLGLAAFITAVHTRKL